MAPGGQAFIEFADQMQVCTVPGMSYRAWVRRVGLGCVGGGLGWTALTILIAKQRPPRLLVTNERCSRVVCVVTESGQLRRWSVCTYVRQNPFIAAIMRLQQYVACTRSKATK